MKIFIIASCYSPFFALEKNGFICVVLLMVLAGCSSAEIKPVNSIEVVDNNPTKIKFMVWGDPKLPLDNPEHQKFPMHEKIRIGMRLYAGEQLKEKGLCPYGFIGPQMVFGYEYNRLQRFFYVTCTTSPNHQLNQAP